MARRRRRIPGPRALAVLVLLLLLAATVSWLLSHRDSETPERPTRRDEIKPASSDTDGSPARLLRVKRASPPPRPGQAALVEGSAGDIEPIAGRSWLRGRVHDESGAPIAGVRVTALRALARRAFPHLPDALLDETESDDTGRWTLSFLPPDDQIVLLAEHDGARHLLASPSRVAPWSHEDRGTTRLEAPRRFSVETEGHVIVRPAIACDLGAVPVHVEAETMLPAVRLTASREDYAVGGGRWEILLFRPRALPVRLEVPREAPLVVPEPTAILSRRPSVPAGSDDWLLYTSPTGVPCALPARDRSRLPQPGTVDVLAAGHTPSRAPASVLPRERVTVHRDGERSIGVLFEPEGREPLVRAVLTATLPRRGVSTFSLAPGAYRAIERNVDGLLGRAIPFVLREGQPLTLGFAGRTRGRRLEGVVIDKDSRNAVPGAAVVVGFGAREASPDAPPTARTDEMGRFRLDGLPAGTLDIVVSSPRHRRGVERVTLDDDRESNAATTVSLQRSPDVTVTLTDRNRRGLGGMDIAAIDEQGHVVRGTTDAVGRASLGSLAPGTWVAFVVPGRLAVPTDAWDWLVESSGGRVIEVGREPIDVAIELPTPRTWEGLLRFDGMSSAHASLRIVHDGTAPAPGVWPDLVFEDVRSGRVRIDRLFPGRYRAIASSGARSDVVDLELPAEGPGPEALVFSFPQED